MDENPYQAPIHRGRTPGTSRAKLVMRVIIAVMLLALLGFSLYIWSILRGLV